MPLRGSQSEEEHCPLLEGVVFLVRPAGFVIALSFEYTGGPVVLNNQGLVTDRSKFNPIFNLTSRGPCKTHAGKPSGRTSNSSYSLYSGLSVTDLNDKVVLDLIVD